MCSQEHTSDVPPPEADNQANYDRVSDSYFKEPLQNVLWFADAMAAVKNTTTTTNTFDVNDPDFSKAIDTLMKDRGSKNHGVGPEFEVIKAMARRDMEYAWSWQCSLACCSMDEGLSHIAANRAAARFMRLLFDIDMNHFPRYLSIVNPVESTTISPDLLAAMTESSARAAGVAVSPAKVYLSLDCENIFPLVPKLMKALDDLKTGFISQLLITDIGSAGLVKTVFNEEYHEWDQVQVVVDPSRSDEAVVLWLFEQMLVRDLCFRPDADYRILDVADIVYKDDVYVIQAKYIIDRKFPDDGPETTSTSTVPHHPV